MMHIPSRFTGKIRNKLLVLLFTSSLFVLLILSMILLYGMDNARDAAVNANQEIKEQSEDAVKTRLAEDSREMLMLLAKERAYRIRIQFTDLKDVTKMLANEATDVLSFPEVYPEMPLKYRHRGSDYAGESVKAVSLLHYAPGIEPAVDMLPEIRRLGHVEDFMFRSMESLGKEVNVVVGFQQGYCLMVDEENGEAIAMLSEGSDYDHRQRRWYQLPMETKNICYTEPYSSTSGNLAFACAAPFYRQGEPAGVVAIELSLDGIKGTVLETEMEIPGFSFVVNHAGDVFFSKKLEGEMSAPQGLDYINLLKSSEPTQVELGQRMLAGGADTMTVQVDNKPYYVAYAPVREDGWSFGVAISQEESLDTVRFIQESMDEVFEEHEEIRDGQLRTTMLLMIFSSLLLLGIMAASGHALAERFFTRPLQLLGAGVKEIANGNFDKPLAVHTGDEIEELAESVNVMSEDLKKYISNVEQMTAERERAASEMDMAARIQADMLPREFFPERRDFGIYATMHPARHVGGDFYDFYFLDEKHLVLTIADVSGKGMPAALFMVVSRTVLKNCLTSMVRPEDPESFVRAMEAANARLLEGNDQMIFVTVFTAIINLETGKGCCISAGHNPPLIYRTDTGAYEWLNVTRNMVMGVMPQVKYKAVALNMKPGDLLYLYTDGVTEARDEAEKFYTEPRLEAFLNGLTAEPEQEPQAVLGAVADSLQKFGGGAEQYDDITMLAFRRN